MRNLPIIRIVATSMLMLALSPAFSAQEQALLQGTLFTTPEQREYLDYLLQQFLAKNQQTSFDVEASDIPDIPVDGATSPTGPTEYTLGGIMRRSDGRMTIWLNNQSFTEEELPDIARLVRDGNTLALRFTTANGSQLLRPGQTIEVNSGAVQERYQRPKPVEEPAVAGTGIADEQAVVEGAGSNETSGDVAESAEVDVQDGEAIENSEQATDPANVVNSLPTEILEDPQALESVIESLQAKRDSLSEAEDE